MIKCNDKAYYVQIKGNVMMPSRIICWMIAAMIPFCLSYPFVSRVPLWIPSLSEMVYANLNITDSLGTYIDDTDIFHFCIHWIEQEEVY